MRASRALAAVLALPLGGCSLLVDLDPGVRDTEGDGGAGQDDAGADGGTGGGPCGSVARLQDEFVPSQLSSHWIARRDGDQATAATINGDGELSLGFSSVPTVDGEFTEVESRFAYDLRGHAVTVWGLVADDRAWSTLEVREAGRFGSPRKIIALGRKGTVFAAFVRQPSEDVIRQVLYDGTAQRYWRIREVAGMLEFEIAGADQVFSPFASLPLPGIDLESVMVGLSVVGSTGSTDISPSLFDHVNAGEAADPACSMETLHDDFAGAELGPLWIGDGEGCALTPGDGVTATASAGGTCVLHSSHAYSIAGGRTLVVELAAFPDDPDAVAEIRLGNDDDDYLAVQQQGGELSIVLVEDGTGGTPTSLGNPVTSQWWRIREQGGALEVATAPDGSSYSVKDTVPAGQLDLGELRLSFLLRASGATSARLGSVNAPP